MQRFRFLSGLGRILKRIKRAEVSDYLVSRYLGLPLVSEPMDTWDGTLGALTCGSGDSILDAPSFSESGFDKGYLAAKTPAPVRRAERFPVVGNERSVSLVGILSLSIGPDAVVWRIPSTVVDALYRVLISGSRPHIGKKHAEVIPSFADGDASVGVVDAVPASGSHVSPDVVFWSGRFTMRLSHWLASFKSLVRGLGIAVPSSPILPRGAF